MPSTRTSPVAQAGTTTNAFANVAKSAICSRRGCRAYPLPGRDRCAECDRNRARNTEWARRRREAKRAEMLKSGNRCQWPVSGRQPCGGVIETSIGPLGQTISRCAWCERRLAGVCRECPRPVRGKVGRALRCELHAKEANLASARASRENNLERILERERASYSKPEVRARRNEYKKAWRKANPDKVRAHKKRYVERHRDDPNSAYVKYHARYRKKYRVLNRARERDRLQVAPPPRKTSPRCTRCGKSTRWKPIHKGHAGRPWTVCTKCLFPCERKQRARNRRRALERAKQWLESIPDPSRVRRPPAAAVRGPGWERLCITPGCDTVVTHRKKKCTKCRQRDAELARQKLATQRGRGRRTDLERVA